MVKFRFAILGKIERLIFSASIGYKFSVQENIFLSKLTFHWCENTLVKKLNKNYDKTFNLTYILSQETEQEHNIQS